MYKTLHKALALFFVFIMIGFTFLPTSEAGKKSRISDSGMANGYKYDLTGGHPVDRTDYFSPQDEQATWWCQIKKFSTWGSPKLQAKWYCPDGTLYKKEKFSTPYGCYLYAKTHLEILGIIPKELYGSWRVEIFWDDEKVDEQTFYLGVFPKPKPIDKVAIPAEVVDEKLSDSNYVDLAIPRHKDYYKIENPKMKVACLVYRSYGNLDLDFKRLHNLNEVAINIQKLYFSSKKDIQSKYGYYLIKKKNKRKVRIVRANKLAYGINKIRYPEEMEASISACISGLLMKNRCSVVDISLIKENYNNWTIADIIRQVQLEDDVDALLIFNYNLFSRWLTHSGSGQYTYDEVGLKCIFRFVMIDVNSMNVLFIESGSGKAYIPHERSGSWFSPNIARLPIDWMKSNKNSDIGIIKADWLEKKLIENFKSMQPNYHYFLFKKTENVICNQKLAIQLKYYFDKIYNGPEIEEKKKTKKNEPSNLKLRDRNKNSKLF